MDPNESEKNSREIARHLRYVSDVLKIEIPDWVSPIALDTYGDAKRLEPLTQLLCATLQSLTEEQWSALRDGVRRKALELELWWEDHKEADRIREEREALVAAQADEERYNQIMAKLSKDDIEFLMRYAQPRA